MGRKQPEPGAEMCEHGAGLSHLLAVGLWASHLASDSDLHLSEDDRVHSTARLRGEPVIEDSCTARPAAGSAHGSDSCDLPASSRCLFQAMNSGRVRCAPPTRLRTSV